MLVLTKIISIHVNKQFKLNVLTEQYLINNFLNMFTKKLKLSDCIIVLLRFNFVGKTKCLYLLFVYKLFFFFVNYAMSVNLMWRVQLTLL